MNTPTDDELRDRIARDVGVGILWAGAMVPVVRDLIDQAEKRGAVRALRETANHISADLPRFAASLRDRADRMEADQ